jgi:phosphoribosylaminoimidazolecarboxamide formyltransferase/IMP cyclohydrolase
MLRAAAKNYLRVAAVVDPNDYAALIKKMRVSGGRLDVATRFELARKAFAHTGNYDRAIALYLSDVPTVSVERCYQLKEISA